MEKTVFKVGDKVYWISIITFRLMEGTVCTITDDTIHVNISDGTIQRFNLDGSFPVFSSPVLSFAPYDIIKGGFTQVRPRPDLKKGQLVWVRFPACDWHLQRFKSWSMNHYNIINTTDQNYKGYMSWAEYSFENPFQSEIDSYKNEK